MIELKPSRSKYFEENNFNEASPSKIGFAHSTPINRKQNINFGQHSIVETQPETTSFNKNDLHATKLTIPNEPMQCENIQERPTEISPTETSNFKTVSILSKILNNFKIEHVLIIIFHSVLPNKALVFISKGKNWRMIKSWPF